MKQIILFLILTIILNNFLLKHHIDNVGFKDGNSINKYVYDISHEFLPKIKVNIISRFIGNMMAILPFLYILIFLKDNILKKNYFIDLIILYIIRIILNNLTILPATEKCNKEISYIFNFGGCCDLLFSGHTSLVLLSSLYIIFYLNPSFNKYILLYNILNSFFIIINRYHYTNDVLIGWIISIFIFSLNNKYYTIDIIKKLISS